MRTTITIDDVLAAAKAIARQKNQPIGRAALHVIEGVG
jgi:hypothetical protein